MQVKELSVRKLSDLELMLEYVSILNLAKAIGGVRDSVNFPVYNRLETVRAEMSRRRMET